MRNRYHAIKTRRKEKKISLETLIHIILFPFLLISFHPIPFHSILFRLKYTNCLACNSTLTYLSLHNSIPFYSAQFNSIKFQLFKIVVIFPFFSILKSFSILHFDICYAAFFLSSLFIPSFFFFTLVTFIVQIT